MQATNEPRDDDLVVRYGQTQSELDELVELRRAEVDLSDPGLDVLAVLDLAVSSSAGPDAALVVGALTAVRRQAQAATDLARAVVEVAREQGLEKTAAWLDDALAASVIPPGSTPYVSWLTPPEQWLPAEAGSLADHCGFLLGELDMVEQHLHRLLPDERAARTRDAAEVRRALTRARDAWSAWHAEPRPPASSSPEPASDPTPQ